MRRVDATRGFTLVELCSVIVIAGVLMALAGPKLLASPAFGQRGYTDELAGVIRSAEAVAVASGCDVQLTIMPGVGYQADQPSPAGPDTCSGAFTVPVARADGTALVGTPPSNADVSGGITLVFDSHGTLIGPAPVANPTAITVVGSPAGQTQPLTLSIDPLSGFVTVP